MAEPGNTGLRPTASAAAGGADRYVTLARQAAPRDASLAARHLHEALRLDPAHAAANGLLGRFYYEVRMLPEALDHTRRAAAASPLNVEVATNHLLVLDALGLTDEAMQLLARHRAAGPLPPDLLNFFARLAPRTGREGEALELIEEALASRSSSAVMHRGQRKGLLMQAGSLLDRLGRYDEAFEHVRRGHAAAPVTFDPDRFRRQIAHQAAWFTADRLRALPRATHGWAQPVFIVGMPRSGTSLVEQILDAHPEVAGAGELIDMSRVVAEIDARSNGAYPAFLEAATPDQLDAIAGLYLSRVTSMSPPAARYVTDKQPYNWMHLGVISRLFPEARVVHVSRDPMDTCLSCYMTHLDPTPVLNPTDLRHLAMHFNDYANLMRHWRQVVEVPILDVTYETVVAEPEAQVRRLLRFLDLSWDERCLSFHQNPRPVVTASMHQVRRPIYSSSIGRWRRYEWHLGPLREALNA